jgi:hypothetical protein
MDNANKTSRTHADLLPKGLCPAFLIKHMLTHSLQDRIYDQRQQAGDGYCWCAKTCTPVGPDDELVAAKSCLPGRSCYDGPST